MGLKCVCVRESADGAGVNPCICIDMRYHTITLTMYVMICSSRVNMVNFQNGALP